MFKSYRFAAGYFKGDAFEAWDAAATPGELLASVSQWDDRSEPVQIVEVPDGLWVGESPVDYPEEPWQSARPKTAYAHYTVQDAQRRGPHA